MSANALFSGAKELQVRADLKAGRSVGGGGAVVRPCPGAAGAATRGRRRQTVTAPQPAQRAGV
jgi:hypothetical protein